MTELKINTKGYNIKYFDFAVSDFSVEIDLYLNELFSTSSTVKSNEGSLWIRFKKYLLGGTLYNGIQKVQCFTLNEVMLESLRPFRRVLLKIDVEGAKLAALKGARKLIEEYNIPFIQIECANYGIYSDNHNDSPVNYLNELGYSVDRKFLFPLMNFTDVILKKRQPAKLNEL